MLYNSAVVRVKNRNSLHVKAWNNRFHVVRFCDTNRPPIMKLFPSGSRIEYEFEDKPGVWVTGTVVRHNDQKEMRRFGMAGLSRRGVFSWC